MKYALYTTKSELSHVGTKQKTQGYVQNDSPYIISENRKHMTNFHIIMNHKLKYLVCQIHLFAKITFFWMTFIINIFHLH